MTGNLGELWSEYQVLIQLWETDHPDISSTTKRQTELAEQIAAIEARDLGEVAIQAKVLADMLSIEPIDPERALAVSIADRLEAMASAPAGDAGPLSSTF